VYQKVKVVTRLSTGFDKKPVKIVNVTIKIINTLFLITYFLCHWQNKAETEKCWMLIYSFTGLTSQKTDMRRKDEAAK